MSSGQGSLGGHLTLEEVGKSWPLIGLLTVVIFGSGVPAYYLSGWSSVIVSWVLSAISTVVGYYALTRILRRVKVF
jgi:hypothetical protein